jgi:DNA-binding XRE family transcriptional regulator
MTATVVKMGGSPKGRTVGRSTSAEDLSTYSGKIGARIRKRREQLAITVEDFANKLGVKLPTIYHWEAGRNPVPVNLLPDIAAALSTSIHRLLPKE